MVYIVDGCHMPAVSHACLGLPSVRIITGFEDSCAAIDEHVGVALLSMPAASLTLAPRKTRILFVTEGILLRRLESDPEVLLVARKGSWHAGDP